MAATAPAARLPIPVADIAAICVVLKPWILAGRQGPKIRGWQGGNLRCRQSRNLTCGQASNARDRQARNFIGLECENLGN